MPQPPRAVQPKSNRLEGLDFARFLAFTGMVFVNFHVVMGDTGGAGWAVLFLKSLEGKAAATFVVLAGVGLALGAQSGNKNFTIVTLKRALFLFVIGLLNSLIFPADILHYYAIYFVLGLLFIRASSFAIGFVAVVFPFVFVLLLFVFNYDVGWNWDTLTYAGFWSFSGFFRNLFFNGWHPVVPWLSFLLVGFLVARLALNEAKVQNMMMLVGAVAIAIAYAWSYFVGPIVGAELALLMTTSPVPPMPQYMLAGAGSALIVIGGSLKLFASDWARNLVLLALTGRQALTLYIAHIVIGMGMLEWLGLIGGQPAENAVYASFLFVSGAVVYAHFWRLTNKSGPIELLMRRLAG